MKTARTLVTLCAALAAAAATAQAEPAKRAHLQIFGDLYTPASVLAKTGSTPETPALFGEARELLDGADYNLVNLEGSVTSAFIPLEPKRFLLRMPLELPRILRSAGIDGVTLANNHSMDYGSQGLFDTLWSLREAGIASTGAGSTITDALRPIYVAAGDTSVCVISLSRVLPQSFWAGEKRSGTAFATNQRIKTEVETCARQKLLPVVVFHWGTELQHKPQDYQRQLAREAIDAGAVAVVGHHAHVLQGAEVYKDRLVVYSLGNFAFGSKPTGSKPEGLALRLFVDAEALRYELIPLVVNNDIVRFRPRPFVAGEEKLAKRVFSGPAGCTWSDTTLRWACTLPRGELSAPYAAKSGQPVIGL